MKKTINIFIVLVLVYTPVFAQQSTHYTQYMLNEFVINPAIAGTANYYQIRTNHRFQWIGLSDPPITNTLSIYGPHSKMPMGFGAYFYNDVTGPTSRTGLSGAYAYNIEIKNEIRLSLGINFGLMQYKVDGTQLSPKDLSDLAIQPVVSASYVPDATFGAYLYADEFYAGLSIGQLFNNKLKLWDEKNGLNKLKSHLYLTGGYRYQVNNDFLLEPSVIIKGTAPKAFSFDISTRVIYKNSFWGGLSFRLHDAVSILVGYLYDEKFSFGYSYDLGVTSLRKYNSGSHELMIGYRFGKIR